MHEKVIKKVGLIDLLNKLSENQYICLYSDDKWVYPLDLPVTLRDQNNSKMLDVMFHVEQKKGILVHIPNLTIEELNKKIMGG